MIGGGGDALVPSPGGGEVYHQDPLRPRAWARNGAARLAGPEWLLAFW
jgi:hypothetical protein